MFKNLWAKVSAGNTTKAMCTTYISAVVRESGEESCILRNVIDARYAVVPLTDAEKKCLFSRIDEVESLHDACKLVILTEVGISWGEEWRLEKWLDGFISTHLRKALCGFSRQWRELPDEYLDEVRKRLGHVKLSRLDQLATRHGLLNQGIFTDLKASSSRAFNETQMVITSALLTGMGNELARRSCIDDALDSFHLAVALSPGWHSARASLALTYFSLGNIHKAQQEARVALEGMNKMSIKEGFDILPSEYHTGIGELKQAMVDIVQSSSMPSHY